MDSCSYFVTNVLESQKPKNLVECSNKGPNALGANFLAKR